MHRVDAFSLNSRNSRDVIKLRVFHGSDTIRLIEDIKFPGPYPRYDFGPGFYLADSRQSAEEWTVGRYMHIVNEYILTVSDSDILQLSDEDWVKVVVGFRTGKYQVHLKSPVISGYIADDRMDISLPFFLRGEIGDQRLLRCLNYCNLGKQYLLRESVKYLSDHSYKELRGLELGRAVDRKSARRHNMEMSLQRIRRQPVIGEKFIDDYLTEGDFHEKSV